MKSLGRKAVDSNGEMGGVWGNMRSLGRKAEDSRGVRGGLWVNKEGDKGSK